MKVSFFGTLVALDDEERGSARVRIGDPELGFDLRIELPNVAHMHGMAPSVGKRITVTIEDEESVE